MSPSQIVKRLQKFAEWCNRAAASCEPEYVEAIREHAVTALSAADLIVQLQQRLVNLARAGEWVEAYGQHRWPLLAPEPEDDDPGAAL